MSAWDTQAGFETMSALRHLGRGMDELLESVQKNNGYMEKIANALENPSRSEKTLSDLSCLLRETENAPASKAISALEEFLKEDASKGDATAILGRSILEAVRANILDPELFASIVCDVEVEVCSALTLHGEPFKEDYDIDSR